MDARKQLVFQEAHRGQESLSSVQDEGETRKSLSLSREVLRGSRKVPDPLSQSELLSNKLFHAILQALEFSGPESPTNLSPSRGRGQEEQGEHQEVAGRSPGDPWFDSQAVPPTDGLRLSLLGIDSGSPCVEDA
jgi:hypothetical protein